MYSVNSYKMRTFIICTLHQVLSDARFKIFTAVNIRVDVFWVVTLSGVAVGNQHLGGP